MQASASSAGSSAVRDQVAIGREASIASAPVPPRPFGLYVHFPWCSFRCPYCDFAVTTSRPIPGARYAAAVVEEIRRRAPAFAGRPCATLFLGGGTPSLWEPSAIARVVEAARALGLPRGAEVTLEANPESADARPGRGLARRRGEPGVDRRAVLRRRRCSTSWGGATGRPTPSGPSARWRG